MYSLYKSYQIPESTFEVVLFSVGVTVEVLSHYLDEKSVLYTNDELGHKAQRASVS